MTREKHLKLSPLKAIREQCRICVGSAYMTENCGGDKMNGQGDKNGVCYFYPYRQGKGRPSVKIIRKFCLECMGGSRVLVENCAAVCPMWQYRFGKHPKYIDKE